METSVSQRQKKSAHQNIFHHLFCALSWNSFCGLVCSYRDRRPPDIFIVDYESTKSFLWCFFRSVGLYPYFMRFPELLSPTFGRTTCLLQDNTEELWKFTTDSHCPFYRMFVKTWRSSYGWQQNRLKQSEQLHYSIFVVAAAMGSHWACVDSFSLSGFWWCWTNQFLSLVLRQCDYFRCR